MRCSFAGMAVAAGLLVVAGVSSVRGEEPREQSATGSPPACPLVHPERLGRASAALLDDAGVASSSADPGCAYSGRQALAVFDLDVIPSCAGAGPGRRIEPGGSAVLAAALAWRCGDPRTAWSVARDALRSDSSATLAWRIIGDVHRARFRPRSARTAYEKALALDPGDALSLWGLASLEPDRAARRARLVSYEAAAESRGEPRERLDAARRRIELIDALGSTRVWRVLSAELPGVLPLSVLAARPGEIRGFVAELPAGRRSVRALVDSGASGLHATRRSARRLGFRPLAVAELYGGGGDGEHAVERGIVPRLAVGPLVWENALGSVAERSLHKTGAFTAIIGLDVFSGLRLVFDPGAAELTIERAEPYADEGDPLAGDPFAAPPGRHPVLLVEGQLLVEGRVVGEAGSATGLVLVDGGASRSLVATHAAEKTGGWRDEEPRAARGYGGALPTRGVVRRVSIQLAGSSGETGDLTVLDLDGRARLTGVRLAGIAGLDILSRDRMTLDFARGLIDFSPLQTEAGDDAGNSRPGGRGDR